MIYTSYFAKLKDLPDHIIPVSICGKAPEWYKGLQYKKLAPKYDFFMTWKHTKDNDYYTKCFIEQVLGVLSVERVIKELDQLLLTHTTSIDYNGDLQKTPRIALICYERPYEFCHRHIVANWLTQQGFECAEWGGDDYGKHDSLQ